jgi:hypothetical protein
VPFMYYLTFFRKMKIVEKTAAKGITVENNKILDNKDGIPDHAW